MQTQQLPKKAITRMLLALPILYRAKVLENADGTDNESSKTKSELFELKTPFCSSADINSLERVFIKLQ